MAVASGEGSYPRFDPWCFALVALPHDCRHKEDKWHNNEK
jgi:hypothetical protein